MKVLIDIPENIIEDAKTSPNYYPTYHFKKIWKAIVNGTSVPDNATNNGVPLLVIQKLLVAVDGEIRCAQYHMECGEDSEEVQKGRRIVASIVHQYFDKYKENTDETTY